MSTTRFDGDRIAPVALRVLAWIHDDVARPRSSAFTVAAGIVASRLAIGAAWLTVIGTAVPSAPTVSMKYSAAAMFEPPDVGVVTGRATRRRPPYPVPLVSLGVRVGDFVVGPPRVATADQHRARGRPSCRAES